MRNMKNQSSKKVESDLELKKMITLRQASALYLSAGCTVQPYLESKVYAVS